MFANAVKNPNIPNYENCDSLAENVDDPTLKAIAKWRNHPNILPIASKYKNRANLYFIVFFSKKSVLTEIKVLDVSNAIQESDILVKIIGQMRISLQRHFFYFNKLLKNGNYLIV